MGRPVTTPAFVPCRIEGCEANARYSEGGRNGLCRAHRLRAMRHGDPLGGVTARGSAQKFLEEVVLAHRGAECLDWPFARSEKGYGKIGKGTRVHRLVCERVHGPPPSPDHDAAHSCGRGHMGCVNPQHLRWATKSENQMDRLAHGTDNRGEDHPLAVLTEAQVMEIWASRGRVTQRALAERYGVAVGTIGNIHRGATWGWLTGAGGRR